MLIKGIYRVYVESPVQIDRKIYLGFVMDRSSQRVMIVTPAERPGSIVRSIVEPAVGLLFQKRNDHTPLLGGVWRTPQKFPQLVAPLGRPFLLLDAPSTAVFRLKRSQKKAG